MRGIWREATIVRHQVDSGDRVEPTEQQSPGQAVGLAAYVHAEVLPVDGVDVGMARGAKEDQRSRGGSAVRMSGGVGRIVVGTEVGLDFDNPSGDYAFLCSMDEQFTEQQRRNALGGVLEEAARNEAAGETRGSARCYLCFLFHSLIRASTSSAWPS